MTRGTVSARTARVAPPPGRRRRAARRLARMAPRRYPRDRGTAQATKGPKRPAPPAGPGAERRTRQHPQFGKIPLLPEPFVGPTGKVEIYWRFDPTYEPPMPPGA